jgi:hypothetical protein
MKIIKNYKSFNVNESSKFNKTVDVPEISSIDDDIFNYSTFDVNNRELTDKESKILNEYISKFEKVFTINKDVLNDILLDIDLINNTTRNLNIDIISALDPLSLDFRGCDFDAVNEIIDIKSFISLKRFYDKYTNIEINPVHYITISNDREKTDYLQFDNEAVYEYLKMIKDTIKDYCKSKNGKCKVEIDKGGPYQVSVKVIYEKCIIK